MCDTSYKERLTNSAYVENELRSREEQVTASGPSSINNSVVTVIYQEYGDIFRIQKLHPCLH